VSFKFFGTGPNCCQCLPTGRDWSKGEKCRACERKNDKCGPNIRANRPSRPQNHPQVSPPAEQPLSQSNILPQVPPETPSEHIKAAQPVEAGAFELDKGTFQGSLRIITGGNGPTMHTEAQQDDVPGHRNPIASRYVSCLPPCAHIRSDGYRTTVSCNWATSA
jgi:hypothetical protein